MNARFVVEPRFGRGWAIKDTHDGKTLGTCRRRGVAAGIARRLNEPGKLTVVTLGRGGR